MGQKPRAKPQHLAFKLKRIRLGLGLTLEQLADRFQDVPGAPGTGLISRYEQGEREPSLLVLLAYARLARVSTDILIDDEKELPKAFKD